MRPWHTLAATTLALLLALPVLAESSDAGEYDPVEPLNRGIFWVNDKVDVHVLEPVARRWDRYVPTPVQTSIDNFFRNIEMPTNLFNNLLQGKPKRAAGDLTRFVFNTTFGVVGLFDPATKWGLKHSNEDFGQTLAVWGVPHGPYLMLPFWGPSSLRDFSGRMVGSITAVYPLFVPSLYTIGGTSIDVINWRAQSLESFATIRRQAFDLYVSVRNGYYQRRAADVADEHFAPAQEQEEEDLYFLDADDEESETEP